MTQTLDRLPTDYSNAVMCCYVNITNQIQVVRIADVPNWYFERVVFPGQRLMFEAPASAHLEIHVGTSASATLADRISCDSLRVHEGAVDLVN